MAKKLVPLIRHGRFYFDKNHRPESLFFGTIPSFIRSFVQFHRNRLTAVPADSPSHPSAWIDAHAITDCFVEPHITWLGHATFLIQMHGVNILTDPIFERLSFMHPRVLPFGVAAHELPPIHAVLISHNHRDHMDERSLLRIKEMSNNNVQILVPWGDKQWFIKRGFKFVFEAEWEQEFQVTSYDGLSRVSCTFVPAYHWSARGLFDKNKSLWGGWIMQALLRSESYEGQAQDHTLYFAGDTAYSPACFSRIKYLFPRIDVALLPIGPGEPRSWMQHSHMDAYEAGQAFLDVAARCMVPMHWGTFSFGNDRFDTPLVKLQTWWREHGAQLEDKKLVVMKVGQRFQV